MPQSLLTPPEREARSEAVQSREWAWRIAFVTLAIAFAGSQLLDFATAQGLSSREPKGYFAEVNPLLAHIDDPVTRQYLGFALKVAMVIFVVWVARLQRRRAIGAALLLLGTMAGLFGAVSNVNPWRVGRIESLDGSLSCQLAAVARSAGDRVSSRTLAEVTCPWP